ncbi:MAG: nuclease, partial [Nodosilinea sp.]
MLDLVKLTQQMQGMGQHLNQEAVAAQRRLSLAQGLSTRALANQSEWVTILENQGDGLAFTAATPIEPLTAHATLPATHQPHSVIATDGS